MSGFLRAFVYAGRGLVSAFGERNFRFHVCAAAFVAFFAARFYELSRGEWAVLLLTFGLVISLEAVNTALEYLADRVTSEHDELIRRCKDCAAGAVLIAAVFAVGVGAALFWDLERFAEIWSFFAEELWRVLLLIAALTVAAVIIFVPKGRVQKSENSKRK